MKILWLTPTTFQGAVLKLLSSEIKKSGLSMTDIDLCHAAINKSKKKNKKEFTWDQDKYPAFEKIVLGKKPDFIVCNCSISLGFISQQYTSLALMRGSILYFRDIPVLVLDDITKVRSTKTGRWINSSDLNKLKRWVTKTQRFQPKFNYTVCETKQDLDCLKKFAEESILISTDIETSGQGLNVKITCAGYTCIHKSGITFTFLVAFVDPTQTDKCFWRLPSHEIYAMETIKAVHANPVPKTLQNGSYDSAHIITYHVPYNNYIADTLHLFNCIFTEAPKRLDFIAAFCLDFYCYWKDESKEDKQKNDKQKSLVPKTLIGIKKYWRYCALDCYNTCFSTLFLLRLIHQPGMEWALQNYKDQFAHQLGPALSGSMRGIRWNSHIANKLIGIENKIAQEALETVKIMTADPDFNPSSPKQMAHLVYDILGSSQVPRKKRSTQEDVLKLVAMQHPFTRMILKKIWEYKKAQKTVSMYGEIKLINSRFMYKIAAAGTDTGRESTKASDFWTGANVQNIAEKLRVIMEPDPGYLLFDFDYSQSDAYFTAFESEDPLYIKTMLSDKDTHCLHAEHFFKIAYDKLIKAKKNKESWCIHKVEGVRSITKRGVYGANYLMSGYTLLLTMGQEAVIAAAKHLGYKNTDSWSIKELTLLCDKLIENYFQMYGVLPVWLCEQIELVTANNNLATAYGGKTRLFFGNLKTDKAAQRELAAYYGQGGTAGNINHFLMDFHRTMDSKEIMFLFQVHDSVVGQVLIQELPRLIELKRKMERTCMIKGRSFVVPVEGQVGFGWGKRMIDWTEDITVDIIIEHEKIWQADFNKL